MDVMELRRGLMGGIVPFKNLIDKNAVSNGYVKKADGQIEIVSWYMCTDYIRCDGKTNVYTRNTTLSSSTLRGVCYYDANQNFIGSIIQDVDDAIYKSYSIPSMAKYFRINVSPSLIDLAVASFAIDGL